MFIKNCAKPLDLSLPVVPPRSVLYPLKPIGIGTPETESLTSYISREAAAHVVTVGNICTRIIAPKINKPYLIPNTEHLRSILSSSFYPGTPALNGMGVIAEDWVMALEKLTGRSDLRHLTALKWRGAVTEHLFTRGARAWCPECLNEQRASEAEVYEHLIWSFRLVEVCPKHERPLVAICPGCQKRLRQLADRSRTGYCQHCSQWLGHIGEREGDVRRPEGDDLQYEVWVAAQVGELVAAAPSLPAEPKKEVALDKIDSLAESITEGNLSALARSLGIKQPTIQSWRKNRAVMRTDLILKICYSIKISLLDFLTDEEVLLTPEWEVLVLPALKHYWSTPSRPAREKVEQELLAALEENPPPSVGSVARRVGYKSSGRLYELFPTLCRELTAKRQTVIGIQVLPYSQRRRGNNHAKLKHALELALREEPPPTLAAVARGVGYLHGVALKRRFPDLCEKIKKRHSEYMRSCNKLLGAELSNMLREVPPPSLTAAASRLGYRSYVSIQKKFPDLCKELISRRKQFREKMLEDIRTALSKDLTEEPPPSLAAVARRLGLDTTIFYSRFGKEREMIVRRRAEFLSKMKKIKTA